MSTFIASYEPTIGIELSGFAALYSWREKLRAQPFYRAGPELVSFYRAT